MAETILFEHPLNEKCRTWLRMSHLFEQFEFHLPHAEEWHARAAMAALLDIANVLEMPANNLSMVFRKPEL